MLDVYVDADACPVKDEIYKVASRYQLNVFVIANAWLFVPSDPRLHRIVVGEGLDRADDWIAERIKQGDIAITADILLVARCLRQGARVITPSGKEFTEDTIGEQLATRNLMTELRDTGVIRTVARPFSKQDRSRFLQALDNAVQRIQRTGS